MESRGGCGTMPGLEQAHTGECASGVIDRTRRDPWKDTAGTGNEYRVLPAPSPAFSRDVIIRR